MFTVIYSFTVKDDQTEIFENAWKELTLLIFKHEGSLGSRLHKKTKTNYIAYAQWPEKKTWSNSGSKMPPLSGEIRKTMKESCSSIETLYELDVVTDLLSNDTYPLNVEQ